MAQTREQVVAWSGTMVLIALAADTLIKTLNSRSPLSLLVIPILIIASPAAVVFMAAGFPLLLSFLSGLVNRKTEESLPNERIEGQRVVEALAKLGQPLSANRSRPLGYRDENNKPNSHFDDTSHDKPALRSLRPERKRQSVRSWAALIGMVSVLATVIAWRTVVANIHSAPTEWRLLRWELLTAD